MYGHVKYCSCEDYPCCGHTDTDVSSPYADMTDEEIKQRVYAQMADEDYDDDHDEEPY